MTPGQVAQIACLLEASARKAGNVHRFRDFEDCSYLDFALSAQAIGPALERAGDEGVGKAILAAIEATRQVVSTNTNLGMVLLLGPMVAACQRVAPVGCASLTHPTNAVSAVLGKLTQEDTRLVYVAIRLAKPGGLGTVDDQDVNEEPTVGLVEAMTLAADRDLVARQYATGYADVFEIGVPALERAIGEGRSVETAIVFAHLRFLAALPDTLIVRKRGVSVAMEARERASEVLRRGWPDQDAGFASFDAWLRADGHARNPGATADLVAAALFAALWSGTIPLPMTNPGRPWSSSA